LWHAKRLLSATSNNETITLTVIKFRLSEGISQLFSYLAYQSVEGLLNKRFSFQVESWFGISFAYTASSLFGKLRLIFGYYFVGYAHFFVAPAINH